MGIGGMRKRIQMQSKTTSADGGGSDAVSTWTTYNTAFASITPQSGQERLFGDQLQEPITHIVRMRYRTDLTFKDRLKYVYKSHGKSNSRTFNIKRIINVDSKDKYLDIMCIEGVAT
tara:strand:- start:1960 stop:2310 length:351 start_codon:yes stop_codon:yes gene_type:complete